LSQPQEVEILLVEDSPTDARLAMRALERGNVANRTIWVQDGAEALDYLFCRGQYANRRPCAQPRLVLLDLKLPKMDGIEVLEKIKADDRMREIPVVMMTSSAEDVDLHRAYQLGVNSYIVKPMNATDFSKAVSEAGFYWMLVNKAPQE